MTHKRIIALLGLDDSWRLKIILWKPISDLFDSSEVVIKPTEVDIAALNAVTIAVERVRPTRFVISECTKVLGPVSQWRSCGDRGVGASDVRGCCQTLEKPGVAVIIGVPPHLLKIAREMFDMDLK